MSKTLQLSLLEKMSLSLLDKMKKAYGIVSGSGMGPPMAARMPKRAPIFLVLPTRLSMMYPAQLICSGPQLMIAVVLLALQVKSWPHETKASV